MTAPTPAGQERADRGEADLIERVAEVLTQHRRRQDRVCSCGWVDLTVPASVTWEQHVAAAAVEVLRGEAR